VWDAETGAMNREIKAHEMEIRSIQFNRNKTFLITASADKTAKLFDVKNMSLIKTFKTDRPLNAACISPTRNHVLLGGGQDAGSVTTTASRAGKFESLFYHTIYEEAIGTVRGHFGPINALAFSPDGNFLFASDCNISAITMFPFNGSLGVGTTYSLPAYSFFPVSIDVSPDGKTVITANTADVSIFTLEERCIYYTFFWIVGGSILSLILLFAIVISYKLMTCKDTEPETEKLIYENPKKEELLLN